MRSNRIANIQPDDHFRGYVDKSTLPFRPGQKVRIPVGARLFSTHPQRPDWYEAGRTQMITVHHVLPGSELPIGDLTTEDGVETFRHTAKLSEVIRYAEDWGMKYAGQDEDVTFAWLLPFCIVREVSKSVVLPTANAAVCWAGRGGYWVECDINDVVG